MSARGMDGMLAKERYNRRQGKKPRAVSTLRPFLLAPLLGVLACRVEADAFKGSNFVGEIYRQVGITASQAARWRKVGLTPYDADRLATKAGLHPAEVWGEDWWGAAELELFDGCLYA